MSEYYRTITSGTSNTTGVTYWMNGNWPHQMAVGIDPSPEPPKKENPAVPAPVAGGAPTRTLFAKYAAVLGGFVGQVVYGDAERSNSNEGVIVWQSDMAETKGEAQRVAEKALELAFIAMFDGVATTIPADDDE